MTFLSRLHLEQSEFLWDYFDVLHAAAVFLSVLILISAADDLFLDAVYWCRRISRRLKGRPMQEAPTIPEVEARPQRPLAIMVPAWQEHDVIAQMLEKMVATLDYDHYVIFAGTYPNDPDTIAEVARMCRRYRHLVRVETANPGPTSKADCLNAIVRAIFAYEKRESTRFAGAILHDCEDVLHPIELKYFNKMLDRHDLIQIPVVALERSWWDIISGTYMDEFAEWHGKDLIVRETLTGTVPSAGVGTCFSRRALLHLDETNPGEPFNTATLTEDYDIAERLARAGMTSTIGLMNVPTRVVHRGFRKRARFLEVHHPVCVREYFPNTFRTSYRQKARWTLGISLQGWAQLGWSKSLGANYFLFRDRKVLVTSLVGVAVYFLILNLVLLFAAIKSGAWSGPPPELFYPTGWFGTVISLNVLAFFLRLGQRAWFVSRLHGWENGLMSTPRLIIGTIVNAAATMRALRQYLTSVLFGTRLVWDKTMHDFPIGGELRDQPRTLEEVLLAWHAITPKDLETARADGGDIGEALRRRGAVAPETLAEARAYLTGEPYEAPTEVAPAALPAPQPEVEQVPFLAAPEPEPEPLPVPVSKENVRRALLMYEPDKHGSVEQFLVRLDIVRPDQIGSAFPQLKKEAR